MNYYEKINNRHNTSLIFIDGFYYLLFFIFIFIIYCFFIIRRLSLIS